MLHNLYGNFNFISDGVGLEHFTSSQLGYNSFHCTDCVVGFAVFFSTCH